MKDNRSFFEKLTGVVKMDDADMEDIDVEETQTGRRLPQRDSLGAPSPVNQWGEEEA